MACVSPRVRGVLGLSLWAVAVVLFAPRAWSQQDLMDWQQLVQEKVRLHQLDAALVVVNQRLEKAPADLDAHGWRGRLLAWHGQWAAAETEYQIVLAQVPNDTDIICGLADVLLWRGNPREALKVIDHAHDLDSTEPEILLRRARILQALSNASEARIQYHEVLKLNPANEEAKNSLTSLATEGRHEFRIISDASTFSYIGPAEDEVLLLNSHWTTRLATTFTTGFYQRFGQAATDFSGSGSFRLSKSDALTLGTAVANDQGVIPKNQLLFEYGHGLHFSSRWVHALEVAYLQHWWWYRGAHVLTLSSTQLYYLPRGWTWSITATGARSGFTGTGIEWVPSGSTRLTFPLHRHFTGNIAFANGTEDFAQVDQVGHFSARTFAGGLKYGFAPGQDISGYIAVQDRSGGETQDSFGVSYGIHF